MDNLSIPIFVESRYKVNRKRIKKAITTFLTQQGLDRPMEVSIAIVGDRKMRSLHKKYKGQDRTTNVLSFPQSEGDHMVMPSDKTYLGDIVLSYPKVVLESAEHEMLVDDRIDELVVHSLKHLLGIHHE